MPSKTIRLGNLGAEIRRELGKIKDEEVAKADRALRATIIDVWGKIITMTPVDNGRARGNWFIDNGFNPSRTGAANKRKGQNYVVEQTRGKIFGRRLVLYNNLPYIKQLEFGGYTKSPKKGTYNKKTKKYEIRTVSGYSKLAPNGMVRVNLAKFSRKLQRNFKAAKNGLR